MDEVTIVQHKLQDIMLQQHNKKNYYEKSFYLEILKSINIFYCSVIIIQKWKTFHQLKRKVLI